MNAHVTPDTLAIASSILADLVGAGMTVRYMTISAHGASAPYISAQVDASTRGYALDLAVISDLGDPRPSFTGTMRGARVSVYASPDTTYGVVDTETGEVLARAGTFDEARDLADHDAARSVRISAVAR